MEFKSLQRERLQAYLDAERAILGGAQSYTIGDRELHRADLKYIQQMIQELILELNPRSKGSTKRAVFVD